MLLRLIALSCTLVAVTGCGIIQVGSARGRGHTVAGDGKSARTSAPRPPSSAEGIDQHTFPATVALLTRGDEALARSDWAGALGLAGESEDALARERDEKQGLDGMEEESLRRVATRVQLLEGEAHRGAGDDLGALLALGAGDFDAGKCVGEWRQRCQQHHQFLHRAFPHIVADGPTATVRTTDTMGPLLNTLQMDVFERMLRQRKGHVAVAIEPSSKKISKRGVVLRVDGKTRQSSYEECRKVDELRIGGVDFDVERCRDQGYTAPRADFLVDVPAADAAMVKGTAGERVIVIFESKNWKRAGNVYDAGAGRVAFTREVKQVGRSAGR